MYKFSVMKKCLQCKAVHAEKEGCIEERNPIYDGDETELSGYRGIASPAVTRKRAAAENIKLLGLMPLPTCKSTSAVEVSKKKPKVEPSKPIISSSSSQLTNDEAEEIQRMPSSPPPPPPFRHAETMSITQGIAEFKLMVIDDKVKFLVAHDVSLLELANIIKQEDARIQEIKFMDGETGRDRNCQQVTAQPAALPAATLVPETNQDLLEYSSFKIIKDPDQMITFMEELIKMERRGFSTNAALKKLNKDLKTVKRFLPIYQLYATDRAKYTQIKEEWLKTKSGGLKGMTEECRKAYKRTAEAMSNKWL